MQFIFKIDVRRVHCTPLHLKKCEVGGGFTFMCVFGNLAYGIVSNKEKCNSTPKKIKCMSLGCHKGMKVYRSMCLETNKS